MPWSNFLNPETIALGQDLAARAETERSTGKIIYPPQDKIFQALRLTQPETVKVCLVGQDPYHGPGQANGLCFSVNPGTTPPPSLRNILSELCADIQCPMPQSGDLSSWAGQGVLMLNTSLTVEHKSPNSHADWGWDRFTGDVIQACARMPQPIVFLLWGMSAYRFVEKLSLPAVFEHYGNQRTKVILRSSHPSPYSAFSASRGVPAFMGSRPFTTANQWLISMGAAPVDWRLP